MPAVSTGAAVALSTDAELLARFTAGDHSGLEELFQRYRVVAYRVAYRLLGREADALDAVQNGFIKVFKSLDRFRGQSSFKTWLLRIVCNAAVDLGRQRVRSGWNEPAPIRSPALAAEATVPRCELERADLRLAIDSALARLPQTQREAFVLQVDGGLTYREIAEALGVSIGTVMSRLYYAREKLKTYLADYHEP